MNPEKYLKLTRGTGLIPNSSNTMHDSLAQFELRSKLLELII